MLVEHVLTMTAICPMSGLQDFYTATFRMKRLVPVETILAKTKEFATVKMFQEEITDRLAKAFRCQVETSGTHSGVKTKVTCGK